jgi:hypothetical protein
MAQLKEITDLALTYSMAAPDDAYTRCGRIPTPCFLWCKTGGTSAPITELKIVYDDEAPGGRGRACRESAASSAHAACVAAPPPAVLRCAGEDFVKLPEDLNKGSTAGRAFLCIRRGTTSPLVEIRVVAGEWAGQHGSPGGGRCSAVRCMHV